MCGLQDYQKSPIFVVFKLIIPITVVFYASFFGLLDQFGWHSPFLVAHFGWWTLISEAISAGYPKVAANISNWLGTRSHRSHLSGALMLCPISFHFHFVEIFNPYPDWVTFYLVFSFGQHLLWWGGSTSICSVKNALL